MKETEKYYFKINVNYIILVILGALRYLPSDENEVIAIIFKALFYIYVCKVLKNAALYLIHENRENNQYENSFHQNEPNDHQNMGVQNDENKENNEENTDESDVQSDDESDIQSELPETPNEGSDEEYLPEPADDEDPDTETSSSSDDESPPSALQQAIKNQKEKMLTYSSPCYPSKQDNEEGRVYFYQRRKNPNNNFNNSFKNFDNMFN